MDSQSERFMKIDHIRESYTKGILHRPGMDRNPLIQFSEWMEQAVNAGVAEPTAVVVSTTGADGFPQSRVVLLKSFDEKGYVFYTNLLSQKGKALNQDPRAALLFFWPELQRQVRITGTASLTSEDEATAYFHSRPEQSRLGAWASEQSREIHSRAYLEKRFEEYASLYTSGTVPKPPHWGGYRVAPVRYEFWQGRENRLHDRLVYQQENNEWKITRLAP